VLVAHAADARDAGAHERGVLIQRAGDADVGLDEGIVVDLELDARRGGGGGGGGHAGQEGNDESGGVHVGFGVACVEVVCSGRGWCKISMYWVSHYAQMRVYSGGHT